MRLHPIEEALQRADRQLRTIQKDWNELDAQTRAAMRPRLQQLKSRRAALIEQILRT